MFKAEMEIKIQKLVSLYFKGFQKLKPKNCNSYVKIYGVKVELSNLHANTTV